MLKHFNTLAVLGSLLLINSAYAEVSTYYQPLTTTAPEYGLYAGGTVGYARTGGFKRDLTNGRTLDINSAQTSSHVSGNAGARVYGGYQFSPYLAIEGGYAYFGQAHWKDNNNLQVQNTETALDLVGKVMLPLAKSFSIFAKGGGAYLRSQVKGDFLNASFSQANVVSPTIHTYAGTLGLGASYNISQVSVDTYWNYYLGHGQFKNINFVGIGLAYHFV